MNKEEVDKKKAEKKRSDEMTLIVAVILFVMLVHPATRENAWAGIWALVVEVYQLLLHPPPVIWLFFWLFVIVAIIYGMVRFLQGIEAGIKENKK